MRMPPNCERFKTRADWLKARGIGGSELSTILGRNKFGSLDELYDRLTGKPQKEDKPTERMVEGTKTEESIRTLFSFDFGKEYEVIEPPKRGNWLWRRVDERLITCSPDGIIRSKSNRKFGGLEIKNVELRSSDDIALWNSNQLPEQYYWQCIQYMVAIPSLEFVVLYAHLKYFTEINGEWVFERAEDKPYFIFRASPETQARIKYAEAMERRFIKEFVEAGKRPPLTIKI